MTKLFNLNAYGIVVIEYDGGLSYFPSRRILCGILPLPDGVGL